MWSLNSDLLETNLFLSNSRDVNIISDMKAKRNPVHSILRVFSHLQGLVSLNQILSRTLFVLWKMENKTVSMGQL